MRALVKWHWRISCNIFIGLFSWEHLSKEIGEFHVTFLLGYFHEITQSGQKTFENFTWHLYWVIFMRPLVKRHLRISCNIFIVLFSGEPSSKDFVITLMICLLINLILIDIMDNRLPCNRISCNFFYWVIFMRALVKRHWRISCNKRHLRISCNIFIGLFSWKHWSKDIGEFHVTFLLGYFHESTRQKIFENFM
jgi:hypothetical protein